MSFLGARCREKSKALKNVTCTFDAICRDLDICLFFSAKLLQGCLKGESICQACRSYLIVNVIVKDRQNFFFHFMIPPSAGGFPGQFVLA